MECSQKLGESMTIIVTLKGKVSQGSWQRKSIPVQIKFEVQMLVTELD
jgi:hypothetical protein